MNRRIIISYNSYPWGLGMSRGDGECYGNAYIEGELIYFISGNSEPKPIKPINHEQPTNWVQTLTTHQHWVFATLSRHNYRRDSDQVLVEELGFGDSKRMTFDDHCMLREELLWAAQS